MEILKTTLNLAMLPATFTSCTKQDTNDDEILETPEVKTVSYTVDSGHD